MPRWINVVRGVGLLVTAPTAAMALRHLTVTATYDAGALRGADMALELAACAALLLVNAGLLMPSPRAARGSSIVAAMVAPLAAGMFYPGTADPVALVMGLPLLVPTAVALGVGASFPWRARRIRA